MVKATKIYDLDIDRLQEVLDYNPETGEFTWLKMLSPRGVVGARAGRVSKDGYRHIGIDGKTYLAHQLAWLYFYGEPPDSLIDLKNGKRSDVRIANLRLATPTENQRNMKRSARNSTGLKGAARFNNPTNKAKYRAQIRVKGKRLFLGLFHTPEEAHAAYCAAAKKHHGAFARVK